MLSKWIIWYFFFTSSAQREGFLSETFHEDAAQADPFYANCKLHTEKSTMKRRKSNYLSHQRHLQWWTERRSAGRDLLASGNRDDVSLRRILRKLGRQRLKFQTKHWPRASWGRFDEESTCKRTYWLSKTSRRYFGPLYPIKSLVIFQRRLLFWVAELLEISL